MDWLGWKTAFALWSKTPELVVASIMILIIVSGFTARLAWRVRDHTAKEREANLNTKLSTMEDSNKQLVAALKERLALAQDEQLRITKQIEVLREEYVKQGHALAIWKDLARKQQLTPPAQPWITDLTNSTATIGSSLTALSLANSALGSTLNKITEPADSGGILSKLMEEDRKKKKKYHKP